LIAFAKLVRTNVLSAFSFLNQMNGWILAGIALVVTVLLILLSYAISVRIMEKKEF
jgi:ABC-2 type transport system permease protein